EAAVCQGSPKVKIHLLWFDQVQSLGGSITHSLFVLQILFGVRKTVLQQQGIARFLVFVTKDAFYADAQQQAARSMVTQACILIKVAFCLGVLFLLEIEIGQFNVRRDQLGLQQIRVSKGAFSPGSIAKFCGSAANIDQNLSALQVSQVFRSFFKFFERFFIALAPIEKQAVVIAGFGKISVLT